MRHRTYIRLVAALGLVCAAQAGAQIPPATTVLPPPAINDPGVQPARASEIPDLPSMQGPRAGPPPEVKVRKQDGDIIQEYSHNGQIYMIRIVPEHGVTQTFIDTNGDGRLKRDPGEGEVSPVYYTIYEWD